MFKPVSLIPGKEIDAPGADLRGAQKVEQYRLGEKALYLPEGLKWNYVPRAEILRAEEAHRTVSAGHCVTVELKMPTLQLETSAGPMTLTLEKSESARTLLRALGGKDCAQ